MSTRLLERRMDLIHTFDDINCINTLTMDTSYPAKLSGIIIKVFKSIYKYTTSKASGESILDDDILFKIENESHESIVDIPKNKVFKFNNEPFENNGYKANEYVLAIIDINNKTMLIHSVDGESSTKTTERSIYERTLDYNCNGKNDNVILGNITNILLDLYKYESDITFDTDEFKYSITNNEKRRIFRNGKFTINVIGEFGIDYSNTDFVYGGFNRQNRSTIMKISGVLSEDSTYTEEYNMDFEMIMDFSRCYIPEIKYDSNEKLAAMYNTKLTREDSTVENPVYYDYFNKTETAHFIDENGNPYGNLFPRRLAFISVEGALPINLTIKNMSLTTFGVGVYCEVESNKTIKIIDSKIAICKSLNKQAAAYDETDISSNQYFYTRWASAIPLGCAIDINCYNANVVIDGCKIRNDTSYYGGDLIINSSKNMRILNSDILGFDQFADSYKYAYTYQFLDYDFNPDCYYKETGEAQYYNDSPSSVKDRFTEEQMKNVNFIDLEILRILFYTKYSYPSKRVIKYNTLANAEPYDKDFLMDKANKLYSLLDPTDITSIKNDKCSRNLFNISTTETMTFKTISLFSTISSLTDCVFSTAGAGGRSADEPISLTCGVIKNIPIMFKNAYWDLSSKYNNYNLLYDKGNNPVQMLAEEHPNQNSSFRPVLFISDSKIESDGLIYQSGGHTHVSNCLLKSKLYDYFYQSCQINVISGEVSLDNCECDFDTVGTRFGLVDMNWIGDQYSRPASFIRLAPSYTASMFSIMEKLGLAFNPATFTISDLFTLYPKILKIIGDDENGLGGFEYLYSLYGTSVRLFTSPKINMNNTSITTHVDFRFNLLNSKICDTLHEVRMEFLNDFSGVRDFLYTHNIDSKNNREYFSFDSNDTSPKLSIIYCSNQSNIPDYFNPIADPKINVDNCNFYIDNSFSRGEFDAQYDNVENAITKTNGTSYGHIDYSNREILNIIARMGSNVIKNVVSTSNESKIYKKDVTEMHKEINKNNYVNIFFRFINTAGQLESALGKKPKYKFEKDKYYYIIFLSYNDDYTTGTRYECLCHDTSTDSKPGVEYEVLNTTQESFEFNDMSVYNSMMKMGAYKYYEFFEHIGDLYTDISLYNTYDENGRLYYGGGEDKKYLDEQDIEDYVIITTIKGSDLPNTGLYSGVDIKTLINRNYGYTQYSTRPLEKFLTTGVVAFQLQSCSLNMNNTNIGALPESALNNTYNYETMVKRSPRIGLQLSNNGSYKISNSNIYAWANVLWVELDTSLTKIFNTQYKMFNNDVYKNLSLNDIMDKTTIDMSKSECIVDNCTLINYNAIRYKYDNIDKINKIITNYDDYDKARTNHHLVNSNSSNKMYEQNLSFTKNNETLTFQYIFNNKLSNSNFNRYTQAYMNANELPIIFIHNLEENTMKINNSNIKGNEIYVLTGNLEINNSHLLNNSNGLLVYLHGYVNKVSEPASLTIKNSDLKIVKDVISDIYIDRKKRRFETYSSSGVPYDAYYEQTFYDDRSSTGSMNSDNNVIAIYGEYGNNITLDGNNIDFMCNSYDEIYGIKEPTKVRLIYAKTSTVRTVEINFYNNIVNTLFDGPFLDHDIPQDMSNKYNVIRSIHTSNYYSLMQVDPFKSNIYKVSNVYIKGNTFNIYSLFNDYCTYVLKALTFNNDTNSKSYLSYVNHGNVLAFFVKKDVSRSVSMYKTNLYNSSSYGNDIDNSGTGNYYFTLNNAEYGFEVYDYKVTRTHEYFKNPLTYYSEFGVEENIHSTTQYKRVILNKDAKANDIESIYKIVNTNNDNTKYTVITKFAQFDSYNESAETDKYSYDIDTIEIQIKRPDNFSVGLDMTRSNLHSICNVINNSVNSFLDIILPPENLYSTVRLIYKGFSTPVFYSEDEFISNVYMNDNIFNNGGFYVGDEAFRRFKESSYKYQSFFTSYKKSGTDKNIIVSFDTPVYSNSTGTDRTTSILPGLYQYDDIIDGRYHIKDSSNNEGYIDPSKLEKKFYVLNNSTIFDVKLNIMDLNNNNKLENTIKCLRGKDKDIINTDYVESQHYILDTTCGNIKSIMPNVLDISGNKFIGNRSQMYYDKIDENNALCRDMIDIPYTDSRIIDSNSNPLSIADKYLILKKCGCTFSMSNDLLTNREEQTSHSYGNIVNTNYKAYTTVNNCGMNDQVNNAYTFTNSFAIQIEMMSRYSLMNAYYAKQLGYSSTPKKDVIGIGTSIKVYSILAETQIINLASGKNITTIISEDIIKNSIFTKGDTYTYYTNSERTGEEYYLVLYSTDSGSTWIELGYVNNKNIAYGYNYSLDFNSIQLFEPINGNIVTYDNGLGYHCEGFLTKTGESQYKISSEGSKFTPNIHLNNYVNGKTPINLTLNNNTYLYNNMYNMFYSTRFSEAPIILPVNKKNIVRMLKEVYGGIGYSLSEGDYYW